MFDDTIQKRINELDERLVNYSDKELMFQERQSEGKMKIILELSNPCVMFRDVDENCLNYFKCKKTADCIVFEQKTNCNWALHIFEMKRTVKSKEWAKIQEQFKGAYYNALSIAGFLGINDVINETKLYTCFLNDKMSVDSLEMHADLVDSNDGAKSWRKGIVNIDGFESKKYPMEKLQVDDSCEMRYIMSGE